MPTVLRIGPYRFFFVSLDFNEPPHVHVKRERMVAIKTILPQLESDPEIKEMFLRECQIIQSMNHPNVIRIFEVGQREKLYFYVMDFIDGENLQAMMDREKKLSIAVALKIGIQITRGLRHIHSNGLIHRDIKPSNILLTKEKTAKIIDFGVAKLLNTQLQKDISDGQGARCWNRSP